MPLAHFRTTPIQIPSGYTINNSLNVAESSNLYFAAIDSDRSNPTHPARILAFDMAGTRVSGSEFNIYEPPTNESFATLVLEQQNFYIILNNTSLQFLGRVRPYTKSGIASLPFDLEPITDNIYTDFEEVQAAIFVTTPRFTGATNRLHFEPSSTDALELITKRTVSPRALSVARYTLTGSYIPDSFLELDLPSDIDLTPSTTNPNPPEIHGAVLGGNYIYILIGNKIIGFDRAFSYLQSETINLDTSNTDPKSLSWNGNALIVYDGSGNLFFYGSEQITQPIRTEDLPRQFRGFRKMRESFDVVRQENDRSLLVHATAMDGLRQTLTAQTGITPSVDLQTQLNNFTIVLEYPIPELQIDDYIVPNTGATTQNPPTILDSGEKYQVKGIQEAGKQYKQILYCIRSS